MSPISRSNSGGGWHPGGLPDAPFFDWDYVYTEIARLSGAHAPRRTQPWQQMIAVLGGLAQGFFRAVRAGQESAAVSDAIRQGVRDENTLSNLVFFARHPELGGRKIRPGEHGLAQEWIQIRNSIVRPSLASSLDREAGPGHHASVEFDDDPLDRLLQPW